MISRKLFWIHIRKNGGTSTRAALSPVYRQVDRMVWPTNFPLVERSEYNDVLNNYRVPLGKFQFRRCLFARDYLYGSEWDEMLKIGFSREPVSRCLSQFFYLGFRPKPRAYLQAARKNLVRWQLKSPTAYSFDRFLSRVEKARQANSSVNPYGLHFHTHTAAMWNDIVDENETIMLDHIYRLDDFEKGIRHVFDQLGLAPPRDTDIQHINKSKGYAYTPDRRQVARIEALFARDFEIYESHCHRFS